ncbi:MAG: ABC transporter ATP-binding protein [Granulosicoccus sp.]|nr:ABC transporter ATP-binding protein [Granulosicoccus sp.]
MLPIEFSSVARQSGVSHSLKDISFAAEQGSLTVILGPSGSGKTTLLRLAAGFESVTCGDILMAGKSVAGLAPKDRNIGMLAQKPGLYPDKSVYDNLAFGLRLRKIPAAHIRERIHRTAADLQLHDVLACRPCTLLPVQRLRAAIGRALIHRPAVLLCDEILSETAAGSREQLRYELRLVHEKSRVTTLYATHDPVDALALADQLIILREGRIVQSGSPEEIHESPADAFVAGFVGTRPINLLPGRIDGDGERGLRVGEQRIPLHAGSLAAAGQEVLLGIRPHDILLHEEGPFRGTVNGIEYAGSHSVIRLRFAHQEITLVTRSSVDCSPGDVLAFKLDVGKLHLFDRHSERRIRQL